ncbi:hypothetical protein ACLOJK_013975 [Asimina triloba]
MSRHPVVAGARPIRKWGRENELECEEIVVLKEEKGKIEGLRARVQLENLLSLLVGASSLLIGASSLLIPFVAGAPASASDGFFEILLANPRWMGFVASDKGVPFRFQF